MLMPWKEHGFEVVDEASSGEKALAIVAQKNIQLIITDITMPKMTGLELMKRLQVEAPAVKVVVVTCHQDFDYIQDALRLGAIDYIVKTQLEEQDLNDILRRIAERMTSSSTIITAEDTKTDLQGRRVGSMTWLVDDMEYERLIASIPQDEEMARHQLECERQCWAACLFSFPDWDQLRDSLCDLQPKAWLEQCRRQLLRWLRRAGYSEEMISGIIRSTLVMQKSKEGEILQSDVCRQVGISKSYFSKAFKDILDISFVHYVQHVYIERARELLLQTNHTVYTIAEMCGFADSRYFSKVFKDYTGMLPSEFRQQRV